jgi:hypothetical protein
MATKDSPPKRDALLERIQQEKGQPVYDARVSVRLTGEDFADLQKCAEQVNIPYTRLAAIFVEEGIAALKK